jgi:hypothetical protein
MEAKIEFKKRKFSEKTYITAAGGWSWFFIGAWTASADLFGLWHYVTKQMEIN